MMTVYTFGVIGKLPSGDYDYCGNIGNYTTENGKTEAILAIAEFLHRAPCDVFIEAENYVYFENPVGLYGNLKEENL